MDIDHPDNANGDSESDGDQAPDVSRSSHDGIVLESDRPGIVEASGTEERAGPPRRVFVIGGAQVPAGTGRDLRGLERPYIPKPFERRAFEDAARVMRSQDVVAALAGANQWARSIEPIGESLRAHAAASSGMAAKLSPIAAAFSKVVDANARIAAMLARGSMVSGVMTTSADLARAFRIASSGPVWPQFQIDQFSRFAPNAARLGALEATFGCMPKGSSYWELERILARHMGANPWITERQRRDLLDFMCATSRDPDLSSYVRGFRVSSVPRVDAPIVGTVLSRDAAGARLEFAGAKAGNSEKIPSGTQVAPASIICDPETLFETIAQVLGCEPRHLIEAIEYVRVPAMRAPASPTRSGWAMPENPLSQSDDEQNSHVLRIQDRGHGFTVSHGDRSVDLPKLKGMAILKILVETPDVGHGVMELWGAASGVSPGRANLPDQETGGLHARKGTVVTQSMDAGALPISDAKAIKAYEDELRDLAVETAKAELLGDLATLQRLSNKREQILACVPKALGGTAAKRTHSEQEERARKNVSRLIGTALTALRRDAPAIEKYVRGHLHMGYRCCFAGSGKIELPQ